MAITKMLKCSRCKGLVMWDNEATSCKKCNLHIIAQGQEIADPFRDCGVVMKESNDMLLITARKKS